MRRIISIFSSLLRSKKHGMTLVELLVYMSVAFAILLMITFLYIFGLKHSFVTLQFGHESISVQKTAFMITKYLHNAATVCVYNEEPTSSSTAGYYIFLKNGSTYRVNVENTNLSTDLISSGIGNLTFKMTPKASHDVVEVTVIGTPDKIEINTEVALNNVRNKQISQEGTVLFYSNPPQAGS